MMLERSFGSMASQSCAYQRRTASSRSRRAGSTAPAVSTSNATPSVVRLLAQVRVGRGADHAAARVVPRPGGQRRRPRGQIRAGDADPRGPVDQRLDLGDLALDPLRVERRAVDVAQRHPAVRRHPVRSAGSTASARRCPARRSPRRGRPPRASAGCRGRTRPAASAAAEPTRGRRRRRPTTPRGGRRRAPGSARPGSPHAGAGSAGRAGRPPGRRRPPGTATTHHQAPATAAAARRRVTTAPAPSATCSRPQRPARTGRPPEAAPASRAAQRATAALRPPQALQDRPGPASPPPRAATPAPSPGRSAREMPRSSLRPPRPASRSRSGSRPTTNTSTARPPSASAAHSAACCPPHVRTALARSHPRPWTKTLVGEVAALRAQRAPVEAARQQRLGNRRRRQRRHLVVLGRQPRRVGVVEHVVERQPPQQDRGLGRAPVPDVLRPQRPVERPGGDPAQRQLGPVPRLFDPARP